MVIFRQIPPLANLLLYFQFIRLRKSTMYRPGMSLIFNRLAVHDYRVEAVIVLAGQSERAPFSFLQ
jgi:hypothetical protein